jgi:hypothetical protein
VSHWRAVAQEEANRLASIRIIIFLFSRGFFHQRYMADCWLLPPSPHLFLSKQARILLVLPSVIWSLVPVNLLVNLFFLSCASEKFCILEVCTSTSLQFRSLSNYEVKTPPSRFFHLSNLVTSILCTYYRRMYESMLIYESTLLLGKKDAPSRKHAPSWQKGRSFTKTRSFSWSIVQFCLLHVSTVEAIIASETYSVKAIH